MKVLYFSAIYQYGHKYYDRKVLEILSDIVDTVVMLPNKWFEEDIERVKVYKNGIETKKSLFPHLSLIYTSLRNYWRAIKIANKESADIIIAGEYEILTAWMLSAFTRKKIVLIHHYNLDQMERRPFYKKIFRVFKNKVFHVVLEPYIEEHMIKDLKISPNRVFCWRHPSEALALNNRISNKRIYDCVGLSNSNDPLFVQKLIEKEKKSKQFARKKLKIVVKSTSEEYEDGFLITKKGNIDTEEYKSYVNNTKSMLVCFPNTYAYRVSAVIIEAIRNFVPVVGSDFKLLRYYKDMYPAIFELCSINNICESIERITLVKTEDQAKDFNRFMFDHSDENIKKAMYDSFLLIKKDSKK